MELHSYNPEIICFTGYLLIVISKLLCSSYECLVVVSDYRLCPIMDYLLHLTLNLKISADGDIFSNTHNSQN